MNADFHVHSNASDGLLSPVEVVSLARKSGIGALAVTDHDTVFNLAEVSSLCKKAGISHVNGVEVSAYSGDIKLHTLGLGIDPSAFFPFTKKLLDGSLERCRLICDKLQSLGVSVSFKECSAERISEEVPIHAMHICRAGAKKGYAANPVLFHGKYLAYGAPAYCNAARPTPEETILAITSAGGLPVLAHPGRIDCSKEQLIKFISGLAALGLKGIEAVYTTHTDIQTAYFKELAEEYGLYITGGSDFHWGGSSRRIGMPPFQPSKALRQRLKI